MTCVITDTVVLVIVIVAVIVVVTHCRCYVLFPFVFVECWLLLIQKAMLFSIMITITISVNFRYRFHHFHRRHRRHRHGHWFWCLFCCAPFPPKNEKKVHHWTSYEALERKWSMVVWFIISAFSSKWKKRNQLIVGHEKWRQNAIVNKQTATISFKYASMLNGCMYQGARTRLLYHQRYQNDVILHVLQNV